MHAELNEQSLQRAYEEADLDLRVRYTKVGCVLVLVLMPFGSILDIIVYPKLFWPLLGSRLLCDLLLLPTFGLLWTNWGRRRVHALSFLWALTPMLTICGMILVSEGAASPYYAGLNLMIVGSCLLFPFTLLEALAYSAFVILSYSSICFLHAGGAVNWTALFNNLYFLALTSVICVAACHFYTLRRITDFRLRYELDLRNRQLTELDRLKSEFFANVSHELRTPLTLMLAPVDELLNRGPALSDTVRNTLQMIQHNGLRLLRLINDLLEIVRLEEGGLKLRLRRLRLDQFLLGMVDSVRGLATYHELAVEVVESDEPLTVLADESRLEKVVLNLLTNATKFTPAGGSIKVRWWRDGAAAKVEVADSGIGIAEHELPHIFDRFRQASGSQTRQYQGLGLGLALARELIEEHGGSLTATSQLGSGSSFLLELPLAPDADVAEPEQTTRANDADEVPALFRAANRAGLEVDAVEPEVAASGSGAARILVVDDEPDMRRFLVSTLSEDYTVVQAADGETGLALAEEQLPKLALLDLMLPRIDGLEVCKALRADERTRDVKVVMLTARIDERSKLQALECGVDDFLTKPFSTVEVRSRIKNLLVSAALQEDLKVRNQELSETLERLRSTEAQLVQSEKMNALGSLAAGLLHEINNPLNYTLMAVQSLKMAADEEDVAETIADIEEGMKRIRDITTDLRSFAYPEQTNRQEPFDLRDAVDTALRFTARELNDVQVETDLANGNRVVGSRTHVTQVLVNLVSNAAHAVESVRNTRPPKICIAAESQEGRLFVHVRDNGQGISPDVQSHIFDPFFTTRDVGQGTGLGLSICHTIIRNHGGKIDVSSEPGNWTELTFDLPLYQSEGEP